MTFVTSFKSFVNVSNYHKYKLWSIARLKVLLLRTGAQEAALNTYLLKKYHISLKVLCLNILNNMQFMNDFNNNIVAKTKNKDLDKLARLITYGNGEVQGSPILKWALKG